jgi:hypothetical protein
MVPVASNESKHSWMDEDLLHLEDFGLDAMLIKVENPFSGAIQDIFRW